MRFGACLHGTTAYMVLGSFPCCFGSAGLVLYRCSREYLLLLCSLLQQHQSVMTSSSCGYHVLLRAVQLQMMLLLLTTTTTTVVVVRASGDFDKAECMSCVGAEYNVSNTTYYCRVDQVDRISEPVNYVCVAEENITSCTGASYSVSRECSEDEVSTAATVVVLIFFCLCCTAIVGGIAACIYFCVKAGANNASPRPTNQPTTAQPYYPQQPIHPVVLPGTMQMTSTSRTTATTDTTSALTTALDNLSTALEPYLYSSSSVPFAEAIAMDQSSAISSPSTDVTSLDQSAILSKKDVKPK
jgi:hypothetical protein